LICVIRCQRRRKITQAARGWGKSGETRYRAAGFFATCAAVYIKHISGEEGGTNLKGLSATEFAEKTAGVIDESAAPSNQSK